MKLADLTPELVRRAVSIYLDAAYPEGETPAWGLPDLTALYAAETSAAVLALFSPVQPPNPGGAERVHYLLRLGNRSYPHMKLALMEFCEPGEWFFSVDTHDLAPVEEGSPDWDRWLAVRRENLDVKRAIEQGWRLAGIPTARTVAATLPPVRDGTGPLVLVVDDEEGMRHAAVNILRHADFRVVEAGSGREALLLVEDLEPDLVVMDYEMPLMDGIATCRALRRREREIAGTPHMPVLLATAGQVVLDESSGADGFLMKPYHRTLLLSFVRHLLPGTKEGSGGATASGP